MRPSVSFRITALFAEDRGDMRSSTALPALGTAIILLALCAPAAAIPDRDVEDSTVLPESRRVSGGNPALDELYARELDRDETVVKADEPETKLAIMFGPKFGVAPQGRIHHGSGPDTPTYMSGWSDGMGLDVTLGIDVGYIGFFMEVGFDRFDSRGTTYTGIGWYKYDDISYFTLCPGLKIQFPYWLRNVYTGDAPWELEWYDYMLNAFPFLRVGFGPAIIDELREATDATSVKNTFWETGLSFTAFASIGIQWMPLGPNFGLFVDFGIQILIPMSNLGYAGVGKRVDDIVTFPVKIGVALQF